jgi:hypothetical protein
LLAATSGRPVVAERRARQTGAVVEEIAHPGRQESITLGVDLASQPVRTAACRIMWFAGRGQASLVDGVLDDHALIALLRDPAVAKAGIDAPFGWPSEFIDALVSYRDEGQWADPPGCRKNQARMELRLTDRVVWETLGRKPLSVSTDRIAFAAMRCARLLAALARGGEPIDRTGQGRVMEVYPEAALRCWGLSPASSQDDPGGYKGNTPDAQARRSRLVDQLTEQTAQWLAIDPATTAQLRASDDHLDALLCALIARAGELGRLQPIRDPGCAANEGWIRLPLPGPLSQLG